MKYYIIIQKAPLLLAVEKNDPEIVEILLSHQKIDINIINIINSDFFNMVKNLFILIAF